MLTPEHAEYLAAHAVDLELAQALGVRSVASVEELPEEWRRGIGRHLPGLVLPWTSHDGRVSVQLRPDAPPKGPDGDPIKYVFQSGVAPVLWRVRAEPAATKVLLVEGSKQCLVAASFAPPEFAVYGVAGCWGWSHDGVPISDLQVADGREVVVIFDADAATNLDVYTAGIRLAEALSMESAGTISWVRLPAGRNAGLDDVLAARAPERRADYLARLIESAKPKIADVKPKAKKRGAPRNRVVPSEDRPLIFVDDDRLHLINNVTSTMIDKWDSTELFNHGGVLSRRAGTAMRPVDRGSFNNLIAQAMQLVTEVAEGEYRHSWPSPDLAISVLALAEKFTPLDRITQVPFVRPDGTICTRAGYDEATRTLLVPDGLDDLEVPEHPTPEEVAAARELILRDWLVDMPFPDDASRANALALILTPFIRGLVYLAPLAVVDGLQMGVGKNLFADCVSILVTGQPADPKLLNEEDDENRKLILSVFRSGRELFVFDEAHTVQGNALARAVTAVTYSDRVLGVSTMAEFPNRVTWLSLGNQVQVRGDMARRVYRIALHPTVADPQDRPQDAFRHPDLRRWTRENRPELIQACLTLVRAWFTAGQPTTQISFGSFEEWQRVVGGILQVAEVPGLLANLREWRSESDHISQWWASHLKWLHGQFGDPPVEFTCAEVRRQAQENLAEYQAPPGLDDIGDKGYTKKLGEAYSRIKARRFDGHWITKTGQDRSGVAKWTVSRESGGPQEGAGTPTPAEGATRADDGKGLLGDAGTSTLYASANTPVHTVYPCSTGEAGGGVPPAPGGPRMVVDLETASATELYRYGPGFVRLAGYTVGDHVELTTNCARLVRQIERASLVSGHNLLGFDLQALARWHGLGLQALVRRGAVFDTLLAARHIDPPMAREKGRDFDRRYDLDTLGKKYEVGGKTHDLKALAKEHGGFDQIPVDDPDYRAYLVGDIEVSRGLYEKLSAEVGDDPYLRREHRVAAIAAQISLNGFRVDLELLNQRMREGEERKGAALARLHERYGVPLADEKGKPYTSPLASRAGKDALIAALQQHGVTSWWTTGKTEDIAISAEAMRELGLQHMDKPAVVEICKLVMAVVTTRTVYTTIHDNLIDDRVHPTVVMKQSTGRWSLSRPGLTVMGKRGGRWREREVFVGEPGHVVIAVDLSQVDMRAVAGLSGDRAYIEMLRHEDPHAEIARLLFGDPALRDTAKPIGHGWNYGRGLRAISESNDIAPDLVRKFDTSMRERFPRLVEWQAEVREWAGSGDLLNNGFGRRMRPDPSRAHTQGPALMGQGAARDIMMEGLLRLPDEVLPMLRAQVHDEIVLSVPAGDAMDIQRAVIDALSFEWRGVPIVADGGPTDRESWGAVYRKG